MFTEATLGVRCDAIGSSIAQKNAAETAGKSAARVDPERRSFGQFYSDRYHNNASTPEHFQGVVATVFYETPPAAIDVERKIKNQVTEAIFKREQQARREQQPAQRMHV